MKLSASLFKKLTFSALLLGVSSVSMLSQAAVTLLVDDNIKVTAINGQEVKQSPLQPLIKEFTLEPGQHAITAKYDRLYRLRNDDHDYLRSGNVSVTAQLADNQTYRLTMPNQPEEYKAAKDYADQPTLAIQQGESIVASQQSSGGNKSGILTGLGNAIGGIFGGDNAEIQNQRAIAALNQPTTVATASPQSNSNNVSSGAVTTTTYTAAPVSSTTNATNTLDNFMQIWLQATPSEREKMRQWIQQ